jgi:hypothetical protein
VSQTDLETDIRRMMGAETSPLRAAASVNAWLAEVSRSDPGLAEEIKANFNFSPDDAALHLADAPKYDYSHFLPAVAIDADTHGRIHDLARDRGETVHQVVRRAVRAGVLAYANKGK